MRRNFIKASQRRSSSRQMICRATSCGIALLDIFNAIRAEEVGCVGGEEEACRAEMGMSAYPIQNIEDSGSEVECGCNVG